MAVLQIKKKLTTLNMITIDTEPLSIGRGKENRLIIPEEYFSREHLHIYQEGNIFILEILSKRGAILNQKAINSGGYKIKHGDIIEVGEYEFLFLDKNEFGHQDTIDFKTNSNSRLQKEPFYFLQIIENRQSSFKLFKKELKQYIGDHLVEFNSNKIKVSHYESEIKKYPFSFEVDDIKYLIFDSSYASSFFKKHNFYGFWSISEEIISQYMHIWISSHSDFSIFIHGETGAGKDVMARAIHKISGRKGNFIPLNCASIPENLWESELFGHIKGSYTGAEQNRNGAFQEADGGTIFLDEIADMPLEQQAKLLRVLETSKVKKLGSDKEERVNVRVIAATHKNIFDLVQQGRFREDLFHRIYVFPIKIPPLRDRKEDITLYTNMFLSQMNEKMGAKKGLSQTAIDSLKEYLWPGNVRELKNTIERAYLISADDIIQSEAIQFFGWKKYIPTKLDDIINQTILNTLIKNSFNRKETYEELGISRTKLYRWMDEQKDNLLKGFKYD
ncbi:sigma-54-dependent Fis family transcriptional regulator [bacterium]|nr:sigma-54-dependent Fis family transcriptional regulator [bacterium]